MINNNFQGGIKLKKPWILIIIGGCVGLIALLFIHDEVEKTIDINTSKNLYDSAVIESGADPQKYTPYQKSLIYEMSNLTYIKDFHEEEYISKSVTPNIFRRKWGTEDIIDINKRLDLDTDISLFEAENEYFIILSFELPYTFNESQNQIGFIDFRYSNNFAIESSLTISYLDNHKENLLYMRYPHNLSTYNDYHITTIVQNTAYVNSLTKPNLIYTYVINVIPTTDNDLDIDMYLGMDIDLYLLKQDAYQQVQIGFNYFYEENPKFLVTRKSVQYRKESNL